MIFRVLKKTKLKINMKTTQRNKRIIKNTKKMQSLLKNRLRKI